MNGRRIAFISEHASPAALLGGADAGGQNVYVDAVSRQLASIGYAVDIFTRRDAPYLPTVLDWAPGVRIVHLDAGAARPIPKDGLWPLMPGFRDALCRFAARDGARYDLIHGHFWMSGWVATALGHRWDIPVVQIFHALGLTKRRQQGADDTSPPDRIAVETAIVRDADAVIAQCPSERTELIDDYGALPDRVSIIPAAVDTARFRPVTREAARHRLGIAPDGPVIVYVGRVLPRKDIRNVIRALALLKARDAGAFSPPPRLLIVGGASSEPDPVVTPEIGELQRLAAALGVTEQITFAGRREPDELRDWYGAGDIAVTTPWYEPFGLTPLEAMACARPVVGAAVGGIPFTVADGVTGSLVPPRDPAALADRLAALLAQPALAARMGVAARQRVEREFTWQTTASRIACLYESLLTGRAPLAAEPPSASDQLVLAAEGA